jgi:hypothetical protein
MAIQLSVAVRNARLNAIEATIGTSAILEIRSGAQPADCATADSGTLLASMSLASDWMNAAASGQVTKLGTWQDTSANNAGTAAHYRIKDSGGTTCHMQGSITTTAVGTGDMLLDSTAITAGQQVTISAFTLTDANA